MSNRKIITEFTCPHCGSREFYVALAYPSGNATAYTLRCVHCRSGARHEHTYVKNISATVLEILKKQGRIKPDPAAQGTVVDISAYSQQSSGIVAENHPVGAVTESQPQMPHPVGTVAENQPQMVQSPICQAQNIPMSGYVAPPTLDDSTPWGADTGNTVCPLCQRKGVLHSDSGLIAVKLVNGSLCYYDNHNGAFLGRSKISYCPLCGSKT